jgi:hypothetical protein
LRHAATKVRFDVYAQALPPDAYLDAQFSCDWLDYDGPLPLTTIAQWDELLNYECAWDALLAKLGSSNSNSSKGAGALNK